jgi:carbonic anhydrase
MRSSVVTAFVLLGMAAWAAAPSVAQTAASWDYLGKRGALNWGKLDPAYKTCSAGHEQSPIDIRGAHLNKGLQPVDFHYKAGSVRLENDGHTITAHVNSGSYIVVDGVRYDLMEYDFHHPSETSVRGRLSDMEVHLLHKSAEGKLLEISVRFAENADVPNAVLAALWPHLPKKAGTSEKIEEMVNPGGLLPTDRGYWTYLGSLSTPPCTEGVRWLVLEQEVSLSRDQWRTLANIFKDNTRPLQNPHGRRIEANE